MKHDRRVLLHVCCGPCLIYPFKKLREAGFEITAFFYNPNIYPPEEHERRKNTAAEYAGRHDIAMIFPQEDDLRLYPVLMKGNTAPQRRCPFCWDIRISRAAAEAKHLGIPVFTTTLLVSPYQDVLKIRELGENAAACSKTSFHYHDFREGYQEAVRISREEGLYRQKYCGCRLSREERTKNK